MSSRSVSAYQRVREPTLSATSSTCASSARSSAKLPSGSGAPGTCQSPAGSSSVPMAMLAPCGADRAAGIQQSGRHSGATDDGRRARLDVVGAQIAIQHVRVRAEPVRHLRIPRHDENGPSHLSTICSSRCAAWEPSGVDRRLEAGRPRRGVPAQQRVHARGDECAKRERQRLDEGGLTRQLRTTARRRAGTARASAGAVPTLAPARLAARSTAARSAAQQRARSSGANTASRVLGGQLVEQQRRARGGLPRSPSTTESRRASRAQRRATGRRRARARAASPSAARRAGVARTRAPSARAAGCRRRHTPSSDRSARPAASAREIADRAGRARSRAFRAGRARGRSGSGCSGSSNVARSSAEKKSASVVRLAV